MNTTKKVLYDVYNYDIKLPEAEPLNVEVSNNHSNVRRSLTNQCLILDFDETCAHTIGGLNEDPYGIRVRPEYADIRAREYVLNLVDAVSEKGSGDKLNLWGVSRPHLREFLIYAAAHFRVVAVWSAGKKRYVHEAVKQLFGGIAPNFPDIIFTYDDLPTADKKQKPIMEMVKQHPLAEKYMTLENTFIVDDQILTFRQNPDNGILIPAYDPDNRPDSLRTDDPTLLQLAWWFNQPDVLGAEDVRKLNKKIIFNTPAREWQTRAMNYRKSQEVVMAPRDYSHDYFTTATVPRPLVPVVNSGAANNGLRYFDYSPYSQVSE